MSERPRTVLVVGATGSIGRLVVAEAIRQGYTTRALVRDAAKARGGLPAEAQLVVGDLTEPGTLGAAVDGIDAVVFTHGSHGTDVAETEAVDYGAVHNVLVDLGDRPARIALMTAIGVTNHEAAFNRPSQAHDWKLRAERLVRAGGRPYTIVRPGWFDYNEPEQLRIAMLQGDTHQAGDPSDGSIARQQIAEVLVGSLSSDAADRKTFELVAEHGPAPDSLEPPFAALEADPAGSLDGARDTTNLPPEAEPRRVRDALESLRR
ncbi:SDR family oxidoreductase [Leifsonia sp. NPDC058248]|uniref:SDR family oxidoreductase n=1 Tax=Leifsonia sp. NPDC058248 TaxID=3346402 RepID=UPI0036DDD798